MSRSTVLIASWRVCVSHCSVRQCVFVRSLILVGVWLGCIKIACPIYVTVIDMDIHTNRTLLLSLDPMHLRARRIRTSMLGANGDLYTATCYYGMENCLTLGKVVHAHAGACR